MKMGKRAVALPWDNVNFEPSPDGSLRVRNATPLGAYPGCVTERLRHWAEVAPDRVFLASRDVEGWRNVTYREAFNAACAIGQALLDRGLSVARPVLILSGNGIEHGLLSLGCLHVGIPFVPLSTAYSLISADFARLRDIVNLIRPGLVFADDGDRYAAALRASIPGDVEVVIVGGDPGRRATHFDALLATAPTSDVEAAAVADAMLWMDPVDYGDALARAVDHLSAAGVNVSIYNLPKCVLPKSVWPHALQSISDWKNGFVDECNRCDEKNSCSGFFTTGRPRFSRGVRAITSARHKLTPAG